MLTESFFVRRVVKAKDPETGEMVPESDDNGEVGVVRSINMVQVPDASSPIGQKLATILGVCWEKSNYPAISWEDPADLEHMDDALGNIIDRLMEDYKDGEESFLHKMLEKLFSSYGADAVIQAAREFLPDDDEEEEEEEPESSQEAAPAQ